MPALVPNRAPRPAQTETGAFPGWPYIDTLYDYTKILDGAPIATLPAGARGAPVAIVGAGAAGMVAAFELLRMGVSPRVFEASGRVGGRNWSKSFDSSSLFAEMGAMRVPVSSKVFWHYAKKTFRLTSMKFPDPGTVPTLLYYENEAQAWPVNAPPPGRFAGIKADWDDFVEPFINEINSAWSGGGGDPAALQPVWQGLIDKYANKSFYQALVEGIPQWGPEELNAFGALGIGSGGFGPLYDVGFLEMLRLIVNQLEVDQLGIAGGISGLTQGFLTTPVVQPNGTTTSLQQSGALSLNCEVVKIACTARGPQLTASGIPSSWPLGILRLPSTKDESRNSARSSRIEIGRLRTAGRRHGTSGESRIRGRRRFPGPAS